MFCFVMMRLLFYHYCYLSMYLSCVNVKSNIWMAMLGVGMNGPSCSCVAPCTNMMFGDGVARHVHFVVWH